MTESDQQRHPYDLDAGRVKRMLGFEPDDPTVTVTFIPLSGEGGDVTADGNSENPTNAAGNDIGAKSLAGYERLGRTKQATLCLVTEVMCEVMRATMKHSPQHSPHEGHSVIREELEELWDHVKADTGRSPEARKEAIQVAAMAVRYALDNIDAPE